VTCVFVPDQEKALRFYTDVLGFVRKADFPVGKDRWLTVVSPEQTEGTELSLVRDEHTVVRPFKDGLAREGIPMTSFAVDDVHEEVERLRSLGVRSPR
jgi:catechol 2,3-dioxygenase-like lactoylglutathione lyase family enzyme